MPDRFDEYSFLKKLCKDNVVEASDGKISKKYFWVNGMEHKNNIFDVAEICEKKEDRQTRFVWLTNFKLSKNNIVNIAKEGRLRLKD